MTDQFTERNTLDHVLCRSGTNRKCFGDDEQQKIGKIVTYRDRIFRIQDALAQAFDRPFDYSRGDFRLYCNEMVSHTKYRMGFGPIRWFNKFLPITSNTLSAHRRMIAKSFVKNDGTSSNQSPCRTATSPSHEKADWNSTQFSETNDQHEEIWQSNRKNTRSRASASYRMK